MITNKQYEQMMKDDDEMIREEEQYEAKYEKFLSSRKALRSKDDLVVRDAQEYRLKDTIPRLMVLLEDKKNFINYNTLAYKFSLLPYNDDYQNLDLINNAKRYVINYNDNYYSLNQKIIKAKIVFVDRYEETKIKKEIYL